MSVKSKPLGEGDESDYEFVVEMLDGREFGTLP